MFYPIKYKNLLKYKLVAIDLPCLHNQFIYCHITLFRMGIFWAAHGWGGGQKGSPSLKSVTHRTMMKLGTVIPYPKKIKKIYESLDTPLEFC